MSDYYDRTRMLVAKREDEDSPFVIAAMPETTWELIDPEEWDEWKRTRAKDFFSDDWTAYDYIEVVVTIPCGDLLAMFNAREITPAKVEIGTDG